MHLPQLLKESQDQLFSFHHKGKICQGLRLDRQIYRQLMTVASRQHLEVVYACCCQLSRQGVDVVVTVNSGGTYQVWVNLRHGEEFSPILPTAEVELIEAPEIVISPARQPLPLPLSTNSEPSERSLSSRTTSALEPSVSTSETALTVPIEYSPAA